MKSKFITFMAAMMLSFSGYAFTTTPSESLNVWFDSFSIIPDGKTVAYLNVYENDEIDYTAFNMTFYIPKGLKINQIKEGRDVVNDIRLSERAASTHSISCNILEDGTTLRVIATSSQNDNLYPDDEDGNPLNLLYTIGLVASEEMEPGEYDMEMTQIKFVIHTGDACVPADDHVYGKVTVTDDLSGVEEISVDEISGPYYDLMGRIVTNPIPGTIVICNGKKYLVK